MRPMPWDLTHNHALRPEGAHEAFGFSRNDHFVEFTDMVGTHLTLLSSGVMAAISLSAFVMMVAIPFSASGAMATCPPLESGVLPASGHREMAVSFAISSSSPGLPQPFARFSAPVGGARYSLPNGPEEPSEGLRPGGWIDHALSMDCQSGRCPGARVTPTRRCRIGHHHGHLCGIGHDPGFHHGIHTNRSSEIQITNGQMPMNRSIPTAPNGGRDLSPGLSNAMPWDLTPQHVMRPNGAREPADWGEEVA